MTRTPILALAGFIVAAALVSCGKQAELDRPAPLWGAQAKADYAAQKRAQAAKATNAAESNEVSPPQNPATRPFTDPGPIQQNPIPGEQTLPSGSPNPAGP